MPPAAWRGGLGAIPFVGAAAADCGSHDAGVHAPHPPHAAWSLATGSAMRCCMQRTRHTLQPSVVGPADRPAHHARLETTPPKLRLRGYGGLHLSEVLAECSLLRSRRTRVAASAACMAVGARVQHGARSGTGTVALLPITEPGKRPPAPCRGPGRGPRQAQRSAACACAAAIAPRSLTWLSPPRARVMRRSRDAWY